MTGLIIALLTIASILLILIVMVQNPKGGGLASGFSSANQIGGVRKTGDFLEKATWTLAIALVVVSLGSTIFFSGTTATSIGPIDNSAQELMKKRQSVPGGVNADPNFNSQGSGSAPAGNPSTPSENNPQ